MVSVANIHLRNLYDSALDFLASYSPVSPSPSSSAPLPTPVSRQPSASSSAPSPSSAAPSIRERLHAACQSPTSSLASLPPSSMRRELDATKHELARSQSDVAKLDDRCRMLEKALRDTRDALRAQEAELDKLRRERERERVLADRERRRSDVGPQYQSSLDAGSTVQTRHSSLDIRSSAQIGAGVQLNGALLYAQNASYQQQQQQQQQQYPPPSKPDSITPSEEDRARSQSVELYLTRTDAWSGAQILQAIHDINSEILQFAASATEICSFSPPSPSQSRSQSRSHSTSRSIQAMHDTTSRIGPLLTRILSSRTHTSDPILVQLALQGSLTLLIARQLLSSFCLGFPSKPDAALGQIYTHMQATESQPTSSKWRSLAHGHIHGLYPSLADFSIGEISDTILRHTADIFLVAGCTSHDTSSRDGLRARFGEQIRRIAGSVVRLEQVTRQEIMSACFEVCVVDWKLASESGTVPFDKTRMADAFGDYGPSRGAVLATTELGLRCTRRVDRRVGEDGTLAVEERMLLMPKVVLESVLDVLDRG